MILTKEPLGVNESTDIRNTTQLTLALFPLEGKATVDRLSGYAI